MKETNKNLFQYLDELTMQIFADRYKVNLKIKETYENNKERILTVNCSNTSM